MIKEVRKKASVVLFIAAFTFLLFPFYSAAKDLPKGNIIGFLYAKDGTTPLEGAVVKFKNLTSGSIFESSKSDSYGIFKLQGIEKGIYTYGIVTPEGDFNADNLVGIQVGQNETAKLSIALNPYEKDVASAVTELYKEQETNGEALIGTIAEFNPNTRIAQVQIVKGLLRIKDKIHAKGKSTDFYQEVNVLRVGDSLTRQVLTGQVGAVKLDQNAQKGDLVYVVQNKNLFPFFLAPIGFATVIAANSAVTYGIVKITGRGEPVSAFKNN